MFIEVLNSALAPEERHFAARRCRSSGARGWSPQTSINIALLTERGNLRRNFSCRGCAGPAKDEMRSRATSAGCATPAADFHNLMASQPTVVYQRKT